MITVQLTTTNLICYCEKYPDVKRRLQEEIDSKLDPISDDIMGKFDQELSDSFDYLKCCFFEALRLEAPVPQSSPTTFFEDVVINGVHINAYDQVGIAIDYMHRDNHQWQKPDEFIPERFDPESKYFKRPDGGPRHPLAFGPFLGG